MENAGKWNKGIFFIFGLFACFILILRFSQQSSLSKIEILQILRKCFLQVWTGNDDCKEETWEECKPYRYPAKFEKDMVNCTDSIKIPYCNNCNQVLKPITTQSVTCKPKSAVQCYPVKTRKCITGEYFL